MRLFAAFLLLFMTRLAPAAITVTNTDDSGPGSLRDAFNQVNASTNDFETIQFNIPGAGVHVIKPATDLPFLTNTVVIDGYSQPGSHPNTLAQGDDAIIQIEIDRAVWLWGSGSEIYGLALQSLTLANYGDIVQGNFIGSDPTGTNAIANANGLYLRAAFAHQIGGTAPADRNIISGNFTGIGGFDAQNPFGPLPATLIQGNYIGADRSGTKPLTGSGFGNGGAGIAIAATDQIIGGTEPGAGNIIAFNGAEGVSVGGRAKNQLVEGNSIFSNGGSGISGGLTPPLITKASPGTTEVEGTFNGEPGNSYRIEVFSNSSCDPSGFGEGTTLIGFATAKADASGQGHFTATVSSPLVAGTVLSATRNPLNPFDEGTSNFSRCAQVSPPLDLGLIVSGVSGAIPALSNATFNITITNASAQPASGITMTVQLPSSFQFVSASNGWTNKSSTLTMVLPALGAGATASGTVTIQPKLVGNAAVFFQLNGDQPDENQSDNQIQLSVTVYNPAPRQLMVTNTASSGPGSLDQAITDVNRGVGGDTIAFNIPGSGVHQITNSYFAALNVPVTIDGYTQPGSKANALQTGDNAVLLVELTQQGFIFYGGSSTVRGLALPSVGFYGTPGISGGSNSLEGCFLGMDPSGLYVSTNVDPYYFEPVSRGVTVQGADDTRIGGPAPAQRNLIVAQVPGRIGLGVNAAIVTDSTRTVVQGNYIGTDATGNVPLGTIGAGIYFGSGSRGDGAVDGGAVGGNNAGEGNIIVGASGPGVVVAAPESRISILGNSIFGNAGIGISLGDFTGSVILPPLTNAANAVVSAPIITNVTQSGTVTRVRGQLDGLANDTYRLEFFSSPPNTNAFFQSEGKTLLGSASVTTDAQGKAEFDVSLGQSSGLVSVSATDSEGATSAFNTFYQPVTNCVVTGDLLLGTQIQTVVNGDFVIKRVVQLRNNQGQPRNVFYERTSTDSGEFRDLDFENGSAWLLDESQSRVLKFGACGEPPVVFFEDTNRVATSITFDASGNVYLGFNATNNNVVKLDSSGHLLDQYTVARDHGFGVSQMDLAADQTTLFYETFGTAIHRYDLAGRQQLSDFITNNISLSGFRLLGDGGVIAGVGSRLFRYDASTNVVWIVPTSVSHLWQSIRLDPDQISFWALDALGFLGRYTIAGGKLIQSYSIDVPPNTFSSSAMMVAGEPAVGRSGPGGSSRPSLAISWTGDQAALSWPVSATGYTVQTSPTLGAGAAWLNITTTPNVSNGQNIIAIDPSEHTRFYRLIKPQ